MHHNIFVNCRDNLHDGEQRIVETEIYFVSKGQLKTIVFE